MKQPPGFTDAQRSDHVGLLHKSIYGLKQALRAWFHRVFESLSTLGFVGSKMDPSLSIFHHAGTLLYILVYVDDIIIMGNNLAAIDAIVHKLGSTFALNNLSPVNYFLDIEIVPQGSNVILSQKRYILELLQ